MIQTDPKNARGNANYQGFKLMGLYGVTDNLSLEASFQWHAKRTNKLAAT